MRPLLPFAAIGLACWAPTGALAQEIPRIFGVPQRALGLRAPTGPVPLSDPGGWVTPDDYPADLVKREVHGRVRFAVSVDSRGLPTKCSVTESSGNAVLDSTACAKVMERARFQPATDVKGRRVKGEWHNSVVWQIPPPEPVPPPGSLVTSFIVETDGTTSDCRIERIEGWFDESASAPALAEAICPPAGAKMQPVRDDEGQPVRKRVRVISRVEHEDATN